MKSSRLFIFISFCHADDRKHLVCQEIFHSVQNDKEGICFIMLPDSKSLDDFYFRIESKENAFSLISIVKVHKR